MTATMRRSARFILVCAVIVGGYGNRSTADVAPPVEIRMPADTRQAVAGEMFHGEFLVTVFRPGALTDIEVSGIGWEIQEIIPPVIAAGAEVEPGVIRIPFTAKPANADSPIGLTLRWNGRRVRQAFEVGPHYFSNAGRPYAVRVFSPTSMEPPTESPPAGSGGAIPIRVVGRWVYTRAGRDVNTDGDLDDPEDILPRDVGVDGIRIRVLDDDDLDTETIWSGLTDVNGYFDTGVVMWDDCDAVGCDDPDLVIEIEADTGVVDVTDNSITEDTYTWETEEVTDFTGSFYDFGQFGPADSNLFPTMHIFNTIVRTHRFIQSRTGYDAPHVQVEYPDDSLGNAGAHYEEGPVEIHVGFLRRWREDTFSHEYGHHFMHQFSLTVEPDYCNGWCDGENSCTFDNDCPDEGHCVWCPETDHDAWNEGWPNWLADVFTRSLPNDYMFDDGTPYTSLYTRSQESIGDCCVDNDPSNAPLNTEGYIGAILRDIEDATQDNHGNAFTDSLCLGVDEIFQVVVDWNPSTMPLFLAAFRAEYPEYSGLLYPTARSIDPDFASGYPDDNDPPGNVESLGSPTHPVGIGGPSPCITVEWEHPLEMGRGPCGYDFIWSVNPDGAEPGFMDDSFSFNGCLLSTTGVFGLGPRYFHIRTRDCGGNWGDDFASFGPFNVTDCNGTGILDLCDISCDHPGSPSCPINPTFCNLAPGCGLSEDCNINYAPDECDIADGTSQDCNLSGVPDECENIFHWDSESGSWHDGKKWREGNPPPDGIDVCINAPGPVEVTYSQDETAVDIFACNESLDFHSPGPPAPHLIINKPSWINGNLKLRGGVGTLRVNDRLDIDGTFEWTGSNSSNVTTLTGGGETYAHGGMVMSSIVRLDDHHLILDDDSTSVSTGWFTCPGESTVEIKPGATYNHQGTSTAFGQCSNDHLINDGTIIKSASSNKSNFDIPLINNGLIHIQTGELTLPRTSSHSGDVIGDAGTIFRMTGSGHEFLPTSSIVADTVQFENGTAGENSIRGTYNVATATIKNSGQDVTFTDEANVINYGPVFDIRRGLVNFDAEIGGTIHFDALNIGAGPFSGGHANFNSGDPVDVDEFGIGPGQVDGPSTITINNHFDWRASGSTTGPGIINILGTSTVGAGGGQKSVSNRTINNHGTMTILAGFQMLGNSNLHNHSTGIIEIQADSGGAVIGGGSTTQFNNEGTLVKNAGTGTSNVTTPTVNTGTVRVEVGTLLFAQQFIQNDGQTILDGGDLALTWSNKNIPPLRLNGGMFIGFGDITSNQVITVENEAATVSPGFSAGAIHIDGHYKQAAAATLDIEIGGTGPGQFDALDLTHTAELGGTLNVTEINNFSAQPGNAVIIISAASIIGEFDTVNLPQGPGYEIQYHPTDVTIRVPLPGDVDDDNDVDTKDFGAFQTCFGGPNLPLPSTCATNLKADFDDDGDADLNDYAVLFSASPD